VSVTKHTHITNQVTIKQQVTTHVQQGIIDVVNPEVLAILECDKIICQRYIYGFSQRDVDDCCDINLPTETD